MADLGDRRDVDRMVELADSASREPVGDATAGGHFDGCSAGVGGEVVTVLEAGDVAGVADQHGGDDGSHTEQFGHGGARCFDRRRDALLGSAHLLVEAAEVLEVLEREVVSGLFHRGSGRPLVLSWQRSRAMAKPSG